MKFSWSTLEVRPLRKPRKLLSFLSVGILISGKGPFLSKVDEGEPSVVEFVEETDEERSISKKGKRLSGADTARGREPVGFDILVLLLCVSNKNLVVSEQSLHVEFQNFGRESTNSWPKVDFDEKTGFSDKIY